MVLLTYWLFHVIFTLPPTFLLHLILRPMLSSRDKFRLTFLVTLAVIYTLPWDSYIIRNKAWGYPDWSVLYALFEVPIEEIFFFVIQTFLTNYLYTLFTIPIIPALYIFPSPNDLEHRSPIVWKFLRWGPTVALSGLSVISWNLCRPGHHLFYLTATAFWASPICAMLWALGGDHVIRRPYSILISIILPTIYFCFTDTVAIRHGTWFISPITSTGIFVATDLPLEECLFFLITNVLLVLGLATIEKFDAIADTWPELYRQPISEVPIESYGAHAPIGLWTQFKDLLQITSDVVSGKLDTKLNQSHRPHSHRIQQLHRTLEILSIASKSFYSASFIFPNFFGIRSKFVILYGFCRETDDLIDHAKNKEEARKMVGICREFLDLIWTKTTEPGGRPLSSKVSKDDEGSRTQSVSSSDPKFDQGEFQLKIEEYVNNRVPERSRPTFLIFSTMREILRREPFEELMNGYEYDSVEYVDKEIRTEAELIQYCRWVAGSVGQMCVWIMWWVYGAPKDEGERRAILSAADQMGCALQLINIARDVKEDAKMGRIYVPKVWFEEGEEKEKKIEGGLRLKDWNDLKQQVNLESFPYEIVAERLLEIADRYQLESKRAIERLPKEFRAGIRAATRVYLEIGDKIRSRFRIHGSKKETRAIQARILSSSFDPSSYTSKTSDSGLDEDRWSEGQKRSIERAGGRIKGLVQQPVLRDEKKACVEIPRGGGCGVYHNRWNGDRIFLTQLQRLKVVVRELWGLSE